MEYPPIDVTTDNVIFLVKSSEYNTVEELYVLTVTRKNSPYKGHLALPGGYLEHTEKLHVGAARELEEETTLVIRPNQLKFVKMLDDVERDKRGRVISALYTYVLFGGWGERFKFPEVKGMDDAVKAEWIGYDNLIGNPDIVAFDHWQAIQDAWTVAKEHFRC